MSSGVVSYIPLVAAVIVVLVRELWNAHRRMLMNRALHEVRRPLQAIALSLPAGPGRLTPVLPVWQAIRALSEVDRQVNGGAPERSRSEPIACRLMIEACVRRWQSRARMAGGGIELRWTGPEAMVTGDAAELSGAIENLIVNAIEHGGPRIVVRALVVGRRLRVEVTDDGRGRRTGERVHTAGEVLARIKGSERHGHGLEVVHAVAGSHAGSFDLTVGDKGAAAVLVLPCVSRAAAADSDLVGMKL